MGNVAVVGAQWGDEGKGKIVDWLSERADVVVRFQGGHNAGHTLVIGNVEYKLSLLPSGVVRPGKVSIIGNGVVVDPWALLGEIEAIRAKGIDVGLLGEPVDDLALALVAPLRADDHHIGHEAPFLHAGATRDNLGAPKTCPQRAQARDIGRRPLRQGGAVV